MVIASQGDYGDLVYLLGVASEIPGGPHSILLERSIVTKIRTSEALQKFEEIVAPLAKAQPYIEECRIKCPDEKIDWMSHGFRGTGRWCPEVTLLGAHSYHLQMTHGYGANFLGQKQWLTVDPSPDTKERIVINRTGRYRNPHFPWQQIVDFYGDRLLFIGLPHEYREFCGHWGCVEFRRTHNLLESASLIAGSLLFIGNQSCANACAEGLKHPLIQETDLGIPDCIFVRPDAQHVDDGSCVLPGFGESDLEIPIQIKPEYDLTMVPPDCWQYPGFPPNKILRDLLDKVARSERLTSEEAKDKIISHNLRRIPDFFRNRHHCGKIATVLTAKQNAKRIA